jgi:Tfp pilus assembly protein PilO
MSNLRDQLERLKKILPVEINEPLFMADIKRFANENGIEIMQLSRNRQIQDDVIIEIPYTFDTRGHYHDYGRFFARLTNYQRIVNIKALHLINAPRKESEGLEGEYSVQGSFVISVYLYREPTEKELREKFLAKKNAKNQKNKKKR